MSKVSAPFVRRSIIYYQAKIQLYRTLIPTVEKPFPKREFVAQIGPVNFKEKSEAPGYCKMIAWANRGMGMYDWEFAVEWLGTVSTKAKENANGVDNAAECPRCHARVPSNAACKTPGCHGS